MWSKGVQELYEPVKALGKGGFGDVWLGKSVGASESQYKKRCSPFTGGKTQESIVGEHYECNYVAIKAINTATKMGSAFAKREAAILKKLNHPHIVKLLNVFEEKSPPCTYLALSYANGPTLEKVLNTGGAIGIPIGQLITQQLISVVAYLHSHAVLHRDLKPDNIVITGATLQDDFLWDDGECGKQAIKQKLIHIILLDFGFTRALQEQDIMTDIGLYKALEEHKNETKYNYGEESVITQNTHKEINRSMDDSDRSISLSDRSISRGRGRRMDRSISHARVRDLSALGNRNYAAPEIMNGVHEKPSKKNRAGKDAMDGSRSKRTNRKEALTECISDYGMDADAFSLGATLRYMLTGVPPGNNVLEYIAAQNSIFRKAGKRMSKRMSKIMTKKNEDNEELKEPKRKKRFRTSDKCPKGATHLLSGLTHRDPIKRTTVRAARYYPWVIGDDDCSSTFERGVVFLDV
jgi:serine/threonine protein kinase